MKFSKLAHALLCLDQYEFKPLIKARFYDTVHVTRGFLTKDVRPVRKACENAEALGLEAFFFPNKIQTKTKIKKRGDSSVIWVFTTHDFVVGYMNKD